MSDAIKTQLYVASLHRQVDALRATRTHDKLKIDGLEKAVERLRGERIEVWLTDSELRDLRDPVNGIAIVHSIGDGDELEDDELAATLILHTPLGEPHA